MVKLREQLISKQEGRITRTQRVEAKQEEKKQREKFVRLREEAEKIREEEFKEKEVEETFQEEVPDWDKIPARFERKWDGYGTSTKRNLLKIWKGQGKTKVVTKSRKRIIPFTEETYAGVYTGLRSEIKQFFSSPEEVKKQKLGRIEETKSNVDQRIQEAEQKKLEEREKFKQEEITYQKDRESLGKERQRLGEKKYLEKRRSLKEDLNEDEDQLEERLSFYDGIIEGYSKGKSQLEAGKDIAIGNIRKFAEELGSYQEARKEAKNERKEFTRERETKVKDLLDRGYQPQLIQKYDKTGKPIKAEISFYNPEKRDYADINLQLDIRDVSKLKPSELGRAPSTQQIEISGKKFNFKTNEKLYVTRQGKLANQFNIFDVKERDILEDPKKKEEIKGVDFGDPTREGEIYSPELGAFVKAPYGLGAGGTGILRFPTEEEKTKIISAEERGQKLAFQIIKTPQLALGEIFKVPLSEELKEKRLPPSIKTSGFLFEREKDIKEFDIMSEKLDKLNVQLEAGKIDYGEYQAKWEAFHDPNLEGRIMKYKTQTSIRQDIASSNLTGLQRGASQFTIEAVSIIPYLTPGGRIVLGGAQALEGAYQLDTGGDKAKGFLNIGLGTTIASTGFKPVNVLLAKVGGKLPKIVKAGVGIGLVGGLGIGTGYQIYKETGDIESAIGGGLGVVTPLVISYGVVKHKQNKIAKENLKRKQINYLKERKLEALKLAQKRIETGQGKRSYQEIGTGKKFLNTAQQKALAREYSKATGENFDNALKLIRERSIYTQTIKIRSDAPSHQRTIDFLKTGKAKTGNNILTYKRYGILETTRVGDKARTFALEFNIKGSKISRVGAKVTIAEGDIGITKVLEKARIRAGALEPEFRVKQFFVSKVKKVKVVKIKDLKLTSSEIENRLIKSYSGKNLLKKQRVSFDEIYRGKARGDKIIMRDPHLIKKVEDLYKISGREAGQTYFRNIRAEAPIYKQVAKGIKFKEKGIYQFTNIGTGKGNLPTKIGFLKYGLSKQPSLKTKGINIGKAGKTNLKNVINDLISKNQNLQLKQGKQISTKEISEQIAKSVIDIRTSPQVRTEPMITSKISKGATQFGSSVGAIQKLNREIQGFSQEELLKEKIKQTQKTKQLTKQRTELDIAQKQFSELTQSQSIGLGLKQEIQRMMGVTEIPLQQQALNISLITPQISTIAPPLPRPYIEPLPPLPNVINPPINIPFLMIERKIKKKKRRYIKGIDQFAYLPDFTSRALGLAPEEITEAQARKKLKKMITGLELRRGIVIK